MVSEMQKMGKNLCAGDVLEVWWAPRSDTIMKLEPYIGALWPEGARVATFASGYRMTISDHEGHSVILLGNYARDATFKEAPLATMADA